MGKLWKITILLPEKSLRHGHLGEALKYRAKPNVALMPQWLSAGWSGEIAVVQSFLGCDRGFPESLSLNRWLVVSFIEKALVLPPLPGKMTSCIFSGKA